MSTYRSTYRGPKELHYADPDNFQNVVKIAHNVQPKRAGALSVYNAQSQINMQRTVAVKGCEDEVANACNTNTEKLSLRFSLSGSTASHAEVAKLWLDFKTAGDLAITDLSKGFLPDDIVLTFQA